MRFTADAEQIAAFLEGVIKEQGEVANRGSKALCILSANLGHQRKTHGIQLAIVQLLSPLLSSEGLSPSCVPIRPS